MLTTCMSTTRSVSRVGSTMTFCRRRPIAISLTLFGLLALGAGASTGIAQQTRADTAPPVTLPNTHQHVLHSRVNGRTYVIQVALPSAYVNAPPSDMARYPTLYLLDIAGLTGSFPLLYAQQLYLAFLPRTRTILVGVAAVEPSERQWYDREFDWTPPLTAADSQYFKRTGGTPPLLGGAPQFLRVLKEEIIPLIDSSYRTSGDRGIEGQSMGGLFVAYAMLEEPDLFTRYAMISPSLWYPWGREKGIILAREPEFAKQHPTFQKTVYVNVGSEEDPGMIAVAWQFVRQLCNSMSNGYYKGLDLGAETIAGQPHGSPLARVRSLVALYPADSTGVKPGRGVMQDCR
jgi:predicted alpha/beta superfamily hydrolase